MPIPPTLYAKYIPEGEFYIAETEPFEGATRYDLHKENEMPTEIITDDTADLRALLALADTMNAMTDEQAAQLIEQLAEVEVTDNRDDTNIAGRQTKE